MSGFKISEIVQKKMLGYAWSSIEYYLKFKQTMDMVVYDPEMLTPSAVFVTLTRNNELRGCMGTTAAELPLYKAVINTAVSAAAKDSRFNPVTLDELDSLHIEISVLSPLVRIRNAGEIKQNVDGVMIKSNGRSGLFLPQVWEHFKNKEDFLNELCSQKAGLPSDAWKNPETELYKFTVFAFENDR